MDDLAARKDAVQRGIDALSDELREISLAIHGKPELCFEEHHAHAVLTACLERKGFDVVRGAYGLATAFRAVVGSGTPSVAVLCEYDALPEIGHACGHNLMAITGLAAGIALKSVLVEGAGRVIVLGCPAEEGGGGKIIMIERGAYRDVDAALLIHPSPRDAIRSAITGFHGCTVTYRGRNAHAAVRPHEGVNALDALVLAYSSIAMLRQQTTPDVRIHGIITKGGVRPNVIPDEAVGEFMVRATDDGRLEDIRRRVHACFEAAALATGCRVEVSWAEHPYRPLATNRALARSFFDNAALLGWKLPSPELELPSGASTDMGNVSHVVPAIQPTYAIPCDAGNHNERFAIAASSYEAHVAALRAAKVMAMTALDVLFRHEVRDAARAEFASAHQ